MNTKRRKAISTIVDKLEELRMDLDVIREEEQEAYDNTPESLQETERYAQSEEAITAMEDADNSIGDAIDYLSEWV